MNDNEIDCKIRAIFLAYEMSGPLRDPMTKENKLCLRFFKLLYHPSLGEGKREIEGGVNSL